MCEKIILHPATVSTAQTALVSVFTDEPLAHETKYQATMAFFAGMLKNGILTEEQYAEIETKMLDKYHPMFGTIFAQSRLTL